MVTKSPAPARRKANAKAPAKAEAVPTLAEARKLLLPYQREWVMDSSRFMAGVWGRQTGKSFTTAFILAATLAASPNTQWMIAAPSERQSLEALDKVKQWLRALAVLFAEHVDSLQGIDSKAHGVTLSNGSRVLAVPGKPDTVRGMSANVWLDEFAFFEDPDATWRAILPSITNPLRGGEKRVIITSTPNGKAGRGQRFFDICRSALPEAALTGLPEIVSRTPRPMRDAKKPAPREPRRPMQWSAHKVPLRAAIAEGLPVDYEQLAAAMNDPLAVRQELDAEFTDAGGQLLPYELILRAESDTATAATTPDTYTSGKDLRIGIDIGRMTDPTVLWTIERVGDTYHTREILVMTGLSHADQLPMIQTRARGATRICLDYTGLGIGIGDMLVREFGEYKPESHQFGRVELCNFSAALKRDIFPRLREAMEGGRLRIPRDATLRMDLASMQQTVTAGGYSYEAPRTRDGHSDRCTAAALAVRAASGDAPSTHVGLIGPVSLSGARPYGGRSATRKTSPIRHLLTLIKGS